MFEYSLFYINILTYKINAMFLHGINDIQANYLINLCLNFAINNNDK